MASPIVTSSTPPGSEKLSEKLPGASIVSEESSFDGDLAAKYAGQAHEPLDEAASARLRRKADLYILPFMGLVYAVQFMDKVSNGSAAVMGLRQDLHMVGSMYSWVGSAFYLGYLVFEFPISAFLQKFPLAKSTGAIIITWGIVLGSSAACHSYPTFMVTRVLLGILEGGITPAFIVLTSQWYKRSEHFSRTNIWFGCNGIGNILGNGIAYGLYNQHLNGSLSMVAWRLLFVILGVITVFLGVVFLFHVPDNPAEAWFLTPEERLLQVERIRENKQGFGSHHIKPYQILEAFKDPRTYLVFAFVLLIQVPNGGLTNFQTILFNGMGYSPAKSILMTMPAGGVQIVSCGLTAVVSMYLFNNRRMYYACTAAALNVMALSLLAWGPNNGCKMAGIYLTSWFPVTVYVCSLSCISSNSAGHTKKLVTGATLLIGYCVGNLIGPQTFKAHEAPGYQTAKTTMAACSAGAFVIVVAMFALNVYENKRRDRKDERLPPHIVNPEFADLTDFENPEFRYAL